MNTADTHILAETSVPAKIGVPAEAPAPVEPDSFVISGPDKDALHILPLAMIPLQSTMLKQTRMVKNAQLESVIEVFNGEQSGSGQIALADVIREFGLIGDMVGNMRQPHPDLAILRRLARLPSFDVYSLRISLRKHGIMVNDVASLRLSAEKRGELTKHMTEFTRPLIAVIYGEHDQDIHDFSDIIALFSNPDVEKAKSKLKLLANTLDMHPRDLPSFLEDFGDIFLSLSYYKKGLYDIEPIVYEVLETLIQIRKSRQFNDNAELLRYCFILQSVINALMSAITGRFEHFETTTQDMWSDLSATRFHSLKNMAQNYHTVIGGALCALSVKMGAWHQLFPDKFVGGLSRRAEFIMNDLARGIESIRQIEDAALDTVLDDCGDSSGRPRPALIEG